MDDTYEVAGADTLMLPNRTMKCRIRMKGNLPGAVIFLHGVNDPGATYEAVETGLCQGLNERLGRNDLTPGEYGKAYKALDAEVTERILTEEERKIYDNPDANLYARTEGEKTHSPFIPFYWGYRASGAEIAEDPVTHTPITVRGQNQHVAGHRLDHDFAREGGMFPNATNNIPDMYGEGFIGTRLTDLLTMAAASGKTTYIDDAPPRKYFVLAAHRLAMLIRSMRNVKSRDPAIDCSHETITIMAHSQGTLIALLAQAILAQQGQRCADCLILVDSPYSVREVSASGGASIDDVQTPYARLQTLVDIVNEVTREPYSIPALAQMMVDASGYCGQTGRRWSDTQGNRPAKDGTGLISFVERDNRGKVYCYFCPEDSVVGLNGVEGIGTFGVPDDIEERWGKPGKPGGPHLPVSRHLPAMRSLQQLRFYQRIWTRLPRTGHDGSSLLLPVGTKPARHAVREHFQPDWADPSTSPIHLVKDARHEAGLECFINGEALQPEHTPHMYGHEAIEGFSEPDGTDHPGKVAADRVTVDVGLGNRYARFGWVPVHTTGDPRRYPDADAFKKGFNADKHPDHQTAKVVAVPLNAGTSTPRWGLSREETPAEARARLPKDPGEFETNNYHSAMLNHTENHRWVTAMDVAVGQAATLDDPAWRSLLLLMANWRYTPDVWAKVEENPNFSRLESEATQLLEATRDYFLHGTFPSDDIVPMRLPTAVTSLTVAERRSISTSGLPQLDMPTRPSQEVSA